MPLLNLLMLKFMRNPQLYEMIPLKAIFFFSGDSIYKEWASLEMGMVIHLAPPPPRASSEPSSATTNFL